jgi:hypothetical protein
MRYPPATLAGGCVGLARHRRGSDALRVGALVRGRATLRSAERLDRSSGGPGPGDLTVLGSRAHAPDARS